MIAFVSGILEHNDGDTIIVNSNGIGYSIMVPYTVAEKLPRYGSEVKIYTYMSVREDAIKLYGFSNMDEQEMFKKLIAVSGVGPKGAIGILSVLNPDDLRFAILSDDANAIAKAPGIGKKTASKVVLELKDKVDLSESFELKSQHVAAEGRVVDSFAEIKNDAVLALVALGYSQSGAYQAVNKVQLTEGMTDTDILKQALKFI